MSARPEPPSHPDALDELTGHVQRHPSDWMLYLRNINGYASALEEEVESLRSTVLTHETAIASLRSTIAGQDAVVQYQKEELSSAHKRVTQLEVEKNQLLTAATPAVYTPPAGSADGPKAAAEHPVDAAPGTLAPAPAARPESSHLSERLPDPKEFDGTREDLRRFTQQIYGKLSANSDRFPTATSRLTYVAGRLSGRAYELILPKTAYGIPQFVDYPEMLNYLENAFGDPDRVQNAQNKLYQLKQKNQDFSMFFSEFQRLASEGNMPEDALVPLLFQGISRELQDMLLHSPAPSREFRSYSNHLQTLDNRYRQHQQQVSRNRHTAQNRPTSQLNYTAPTRAAVSLEPVKRNQSPHPEGDPMDLSSQRRRQFIPGTRREKGQCFRCGSSQHLVARCPEPDNRPRTHIRSTQTFRPGSPNSARSYSPPRSPEASINGVSLD